MSQALLKRRNPLAEPFAEDTIISVERAIRIVEHLADLTDGGSLADIARHLEVNKGIASKLVATLESLGVLWRDDRTQRYNLTFMISNLGLRVMQKTRLLDQCAPILKTLAEETGELVRLAIVENADRITWVHSIAGNRWSLQINPTYSLKICLHLHAVGRAWLSTMPFGRALKLMLRQGIVPLTAASKTDVKAIREELELSVRRGFSCSFEETETGVIAIAAPIMVMALGGERECVGAVSLAAPTNRMNESTLIACAPQLLRAVDRLAHIWPLEPRTLRAVLKPRRSSPSSN